MDQHNAFLYNGIHFQQGKEVGGQKKSKVLYTNVDCSPTPLGQEHHLGRTEMKRFDSIDFKCLRTQYRRVSHYQTDPLVVSVSAKVHEYVNAACILETCLTRE